VQPRFGGSQPAFSSLIAISAVTPLWPFNNSDRVTRETPSHFAAAVTERSSGFRQSSRMISPGWGGLNISICSLLSDQW
jgi:hypothetical protein